jgi:hypothetical protein
VKKIEGELKIREGLTSLNTNNFITGARCRFDGLKKNRLNNLMKQLRSILLLKLQRLEKA